MSSLAAISGTALILDGDTIKEIKEIKERFLDLFPWNTSGTIKVDLSK